MCVYPCSERTLCPGDHQQARLVPASKPSDTGPSQFPEFISFHLSGRGDLSPILSQKGTAPLSWKRMDRGHPQRSGKTVLLAREGFPVLERELGVKS